MILKQLTSELLEKFTSEIKQPQNFDKIKLHLLEPMIFYATYKFYPYFLIVVILFMIIVLVSLINLFILIRINLKHKI